MCSLHPPCPRNQVHEHRRMILQDCTQAQIPPGGREVSVANCAGDPLEVPGLEIALGDKVHAFRMRSDGRRIQARAGDVALEPLVDDSPGKRPVMIGRVCLAASEELPELPFRTFRAEMSFGALAIPAVPELDHSVTLRTLGRLKRGRILKLLEVVLVRAVVDVHLGLDLLAAFGAILPAARMSLVVVETAERVAGMVPRAAVRRVGEHDVVLLVVADRATTAFGRGQPLRLSAQTAACLPGSGVPSGTSSSLFHVALPPRTGPEFCLNDTCPSRSLTVPVRSDPGGF